MAAPGVMAVAVVGCRQEIEIYADSEQVWATNLRADSLDQTPDLAAYEHPARELTARVETTERDTELVFFPFDPQESFTPFQQNGWNLNPTPVDRSVGFFHPSGDGDVSTFPFGAYLYNLNGGEAKALRALYQRRHGECEVEVPWEAIVSEVLRNINNYYGEGEDCTKLWCPTYRITYSQRIGASFLREVSGKGQGGFGLHVRGRVRFDSQFINNMTVAGTAAYDVRLGPSGQPEFAVAAGPSALTTECTTCPRGKVHDATVRSLREAAPELNTIISECMAAPVATAWGCDDVGTWGSTQCAGSLEATLIATGAALEIVARGGSGEEVRAFREVVHNPQNWRCAPVSQQCSGMLGFEATTEPGCQLRLTAVDLVPMPGKVSVVWHPADPFSLPATTGQALYLAAVQGGLTDVLDLLCSPRRSVDAHSFFRMDR